MIKRKDEGGRMKDEVEWMKAEGRKARRNI
jgi:hypothetical protein